MVPASLKRHTVSPSDHRTGDCAVGRRRRRRGIQTHAPSVARAVLGVIGRSAQLAGGAECTPGDSRITRSECQPRRRAQRAARLSGQAPRACPSRDHGICRTGALPRRVFSLLRSSTTRTPSRSRSPHPEADVGDCVAVELHPRRRVTTQRIAASIVRSASGISRKLRGFRLYSISPDRGRQSGSHESLERHTL